VEVAHENHDATLSFTVSSGYLLQLRDLIFVPHGHHRRGRRNKRTHEINDGIEPGNEIGSLHQFLAAQGEKSEIARPGAYAGDHERTSISAGKK